MALELVIRQVRMLNGPASLGVLAVMLMTGVLSLTAQQPAESVKPLDVEAVALPRGPLEAPLSPERISASYALGPNDGIRVWVVESNEVPSVPLRMAVAQDAPGHAQQHGRVASVELRKGFPIPRSDQRNEVHDLYPFE